MGPLCFWQCLKFNLLIQANMEETIVEKEEMVEREMRDNTGEDEIINAP